MPATFDAFISYSSGDLRRVKRVHRFLECFRFGSPKRRVRVFLDRTDIRGGELNDQIREALRASRTLIVCASPAAAESAWVAKEIQFFRECHGPLNIAVVLLGGQDSAVRFETLGDLECRRHDIRRGWWLRILRPAARLELLRLLAFVTSADLRSLRNWHLRRTARNLLVALLLAALPPLGILSFPVDDWSTMDLKVGQQPLYALAAEVDGDRLWVASRFRAPGPQGFRNYIRVTTNYFGAPDQYSFERRYGMRRRLLPATIVTSDMAERIPRIRLSDITSRAPAHAPFVGEPRPGRFIAVQAVGPTEEELEDARDAAQDTHQGIPKAKGAVVVASDGSQTNAWEIPDLSPHWQERLASGDPASPARGLSVAWTVDAGIWLGMAGWDAEASGGLWHSADAGKSWKRVEGFSSVNSIGVETVQDKTLSVTIAESNFERWRGPFLEPYPTRVRRRTLPHGQWQDAPMPPFGARSEVELCGTLNGVPIVRVDTGVFRYQRIPMWRYLRGD